MPGIAGADVAWRLSGDTRRSDLALRYQRANVVVLCSPIPI